MAVEPHGEQGEWGVSAREVAAVRTVSALEGPRLKRGVPAMLLGSPGASDKRGPSPRVSTLRPPSVSRQVRMASTITGFDLSWLNRNGSSCTPRRSQESVSSAIRPYNSRISSHSAKAVGSIDCPSTAVSRSTSRDKPTASCTPIDPSPSRSYSMKPKADARESCPDIGRNQRSIIVTHSRTLMSPPPSVSMISNNFPASIGLGAPTTRMGFSMNTFLLSLRSASLNAS
mmetsp:Transcript_25054/g.72072  ORF Transcript_25054/g.72072 Transcript_25054/m.72072 type:complete len:229 (-) Transcript_25054:2841-3527(-)